MPSKIFLLPFSFLLFLAFSNAQNLPDSWSISNDGRMLLAGGENNEGFFAANEIRNFELEFEQTDWWELLIENFETGTDILATCWIDGIQFDSVGVRFKGQTSYAQNDTEKKSFNVKLDHIIKGQDVEGYNTFNLNCGWKDNSSMREVLYNNIGHNYYMSLKSNYVNLTLNGENWGPYQSIQQFDSDYIKEWYLSNDGTIWRALRIGEGGGDDSGMFGVGRSTLNYNGPDSTDYNLDYTIKRTELEDPWAGLIAACDVLNNEPLETLEDELYKVFDIDKACWFLAHEVIFADDDSYINKGGMDYFVYYEKETGRIVPMEYDGNSVLATNHLLWKLFYKENQIDYPLKDLMWEVPAIRQRFLAHVRVILDEYFNSEFIDPRLDMWAELIDQAVQDDPKKFYTYEQFQSSVIALKEGIIKRRNRLLDDDEMLGIESLQVENVAYSVNGNLWELPDATSVVDVVADVNSAFVDIEFVWLYYGEGLTGVFSKTKMFDDGLHKDGEASDGQYGASIPAISGGTYVRYYIEAIADDEALTATYEPKGAEHDVFLYRVKLESVSDSPLVINELMASNNETEADQDGEFDDWIEFYNKGNIDLDISGYFLTDDESDLTKWSFPVGTAIESGGYLVVWADSDEDQAGLHTNFKLSASGEVLYLLEPTGNSVVDVVTFMDQNSDISYGRLPNGTGNFQVMDPTFDSENMGVVGTKANQNSGFSAKIFPNPTEDVLNIIVDYERNSTATLYDFSGVFLHRSHFSKETQIEMGDLAKGIYIVRVENDGGALIAKVVVQ